MAEIGPRLVLHPIKIFDGIFSGPILYEDPYYVSPNTYRREKRLASSGKYEVIEQEVLSSLFFF
jgi:ribosome biogenesis protein BRX1